MRACVRVRACMCGETGEKEKELLRIRGEEDGAGAHQDEILLLDYIRSGISVTSLSPSLVEEKYRRKSRSQSIGAGSGRNGGGESGFSGGGRGSRSSRKGGRGIRSSRGGGRGNRSSRGGE